MSLKVRRIIIGVVVFLLLCLIFVPKRFFYKAKKFSDINGNNVSKQAELIEGVRNIQSDLVDIETLNFINCLDVEQLDWSWETKVFGGLIDDLPEEEQELFNQRKLLSVYSDATWELITGFVNTSQDNEYNMLAFHNIQALGYLDSDETILACIFDNIPDKLVIWKQLMPNYSEDLLSVGVGAKNIRVQIITQETGSREVMYLVG